MRTKVRTILKKLFSQSEIAKTKNQKSKHNFSTDSRREGLDKIIGVLGQNLQKVRKWEGRMGTDTELKLADILRYYVAESDAAKDLLYR